MMESQMNNILSNSKAVDELYEAWIKDLSNQISKQINIQILNNATKYMIKPSEYRPGTFLRCENGDIFLHDGHQNADGLLVVCMYRKKTGLIEWSTGQGNFCYGGKVEAASSIEIEDMMRKLTYECEKRYY